MLILIENLFHKIPRGVGRGGRFAFTSGELFQLIKGGPHWLINRGMAVSKDIEFTEAQGCPRETKLRIPAAALSSAV